MEVISNRRSSLNPNAPLFVPMAYQTVEDFSDQWWALIKSSPWFRDYWLQERFHDPENDPQFFDIYDLALPDDVDDYPFVDDYVTKKEEKEYGGELVSMGMMKWKKGGAWSRQAARYVEKAPKIVNVKVSPRTIQQPR